MLNAETDLKSRAKEYARRIIRLWVAWPEETAPRVLGRQLSRSGASVGANYREASRERSKAEFIARVGDCLKEIDETAYGLELPVDEKIVSGRKLAALPDETNQLTAIFVTVLGHSKGL